jgi:formylglycine-generating enzyme required for sulfatase activity
MKHRTFFVSITLLCAALTFWGCENIPAGLLGEAPLTIFTFTPVPLREGEAEAGMKAGEFSIEGVTLDDGEDEAGRDNGKFEVSGTELILKEAPPGGPQYVKFNVSGITHAQIIFVAFAEGPAGLNFVPGYRLMTDTAAARGLAPVGSFEPEGGLGPYGYTLVEGADGNDKDNSSFRGGPDGIYARSPLDAGEYNIYVRCAAKNGRFYQKALSFTVAAYAPPDFTDGQDFVRFEQALVEGSLDYESVIFLDGRNLTIPAFELAKYETTRALWWDVYAWATKKGSYTSRSGQQYTFVTQNTKNKGKVLPSAAPDEADAGKPQTHLWWPNVLLWLNAFSEKQGLKPVYYTDAEFETPMRSFTNTSASGTPTLLNNAIYTDWDADGYRLPCEAEWEFAARGGAPSVDPASPWMYRYAGTDDWLELQTKYAWTNHDTIGIDKNSPLPVGTKLPNTAGLYDMTGNAKEWCGDHCVTQLHNDLNTKSPLRGPIYDAADPTKDSKAKYRPVRGGDYSISDNGAGALSLRIRVLSTATANDQPAVNTGFRIARTVTAGQ